MSQTELPRDSEMAKDIQRQLDQLLREQDEGSPTANYIVGRAKKTAADETLNVFDDKAHEILEDTPTGLPSTKPQLVYYDEPVTVMSNEQINKLLERSRSRYRGGRVPTSEEITAAKFGGRKNR